MTARISLIVFFLVGFSFVGCFDKELSTPASKGTYTVSLGEIRHGYKPTGNLFQGVGDLQASDYFTNISFVTNFVGYKNTSSLSAFAFEGPVGISSVVNEIHFTCTQGTYSNTGENEKMDDIVTVKFNNKEYLLDAFNSLPKEMRILSSNNVKFFLNKRPSEREKYRFTVDVIIDDITHQRTTNETWIN